MDDIMKQWLNAPELICYDCREIRNKIVACNRRTSTPAEAFCQQKGYVCPECGADYTVG